MKTYKTKEGDFLLASSNLEIVNALKNNGRFTADETPKQYIKGFAKRFNEYEGKQIRFDSVDNFVVDLLGCGYLKEV